MATRKRATKATRETSGGGLVLVTKGGKRRALVGAPPALAGTRPGDVLYGPLFGSTPESFLLVENFFFWTGSVWENSSTVIQLSAADAADIKKLSKIRRRYLKLYGYL